MPLTCAQGYRHDEAEHNEHFVRHQPAEIAEQVTHCKDTSLDTGGDIAWDNPADGRELGRSWLPQQLESWDLVCIIPVKAAVHWERPGCALAQSSPNLTMR